MAVSKLERRKKLKRRIRKNIYGTAETPRLTVYRSNRHISAQLIDDEKQETLVSLTSLNKEFADAKGNKSEKAALVGEAFAKKAIEAKIKEAVFDRNGYLYHGRVKSFADGARKGGLKL